MCCVAQLGLVLCYPQLCAGLCIYRGHCYSTGTRILQLDQLGCVPTVILRFSLIRLLCRAAYGCSAERHKAKDLSLHGATPQAGSTESVISG